MRNARATGVVPVPPRLAQLTGAGHRYIGDVTGTRCPSIEWQGGEGRGPGSSGCGGCAIGCQWDSWDSGWKWMGNVDVDRFALLLLRDRDSAIFTFRGRGPRRLLVCSALMALSAAAESANWTNAHPLDHPLQSLTKYTSMTSPNGANTARTSFVPAATVVAV